MSQTIRVAAIQLDAALSSVADRLARLEQHIANAARQGAQLVTLPAQFATGMSYDDVLYERSEPIDGQIVQWMQAQARQHQVHVAGSLLLWDVDEIYHAALLIAPDGHIWRYDQQFPYLWERTLFRDGDLILVAETALGKIGLLLNWDAAHPDVWERYAGHVDVMLLLHSLPDASQMQILTGDVSASWHETGLGALLSEHADYLAQAPDLTRWMGVPLVMAGGAGIFDSILPAPRQSLGPLIAFRQDLWAYPKEAHDVRLQAPFVQHTAIYDAEGTSINRAQPAANELIYADLSLPDVLPHPQQQQPAATIPLMTLIAVDAFTSATMPPIYQRGARRQWGARMAPASHKTRIWVWTVILGMILSFFLGKRLRRK